MRFDGPTSKELRDALDQAFSVKSFDRMLFDWFSHRLEWFSPADDKEGMLFETINWFNQRYTTDKLVKAAVLTVPTSPQLQAFRRKHLGAGAQLSPELDELIRFALANPQSPRVKALAAALAQHAAEGVHEPIESDALQRAVTEMGYLDPPSFRKGMAEMESSVCRVELPDGSKGTGFLLAVDLVMTNYHVVKPVLNNAAAAAQIKLRFDYTQFPNESTPTGTLFNVAKIEAWSPYSDMDVKIAPEHDAEPDKLDFALLRVNGRPGDEKVGGDANKATDAPLRGWIVPPVLPPELKPGTPLAILQHPDGKPLKLALDTLGVIKENDAKTRVRYRVNTEKGSSGSPCFDLRWNLVALHHAGDPNYAELSTYNQGIPFPAILAYLEANYRSIKDELDATAA